MTSYQSLPCNWTRCARCSRKAHFPAQGSILDRLYPGVTFCEGCGRRQLFCRCEPAA